MWKFVYFMIFISGGLALADTLIAAFAAANAAEGMEKIFATFIAFKSAAAAFMMFGVAAAVKTVIDAAERKAWKAAKKAAKNRPAERFLRTEPGKSDEKISDKSTA